MPCFVGSIPCTPLRRRVLGTTVTRIELVGMEDVCVAWKMRYVRRLEAAFGVEGDFCEGDERRKEIAQSRRG